LLHNGDVKCVGDEVLMLTMKSQPKLPPLPRQVWVLGWVSFLMDIGSKMIQSVLPLFLVTTLGANLVTVGLIEGIAEITAAGLKVGSGLISDRGGQHRKWLAVGGYGFSALMMPLYAIAASPAWILVARIGDRVGKGIRVAPRNALVADATPAAQRGAAYGLRYTLDTIGALLGPIVATVLLALSGQNTRLVFGVAMVPAALAVVVLILGIQAPTPTAISSTETSSQPKSSGWSWQQLKHLGAGYWHLVGVAFLFNLGNSSDAFLLLKAESVGISFAAVPIALTVIHAVSAVSAYPAGWLSDRLSRRGVLWSGLGLFALTYGGFAIARQPWQIWLLLGLYGLYQGVTQGVLLAMISTQISPQSRGAAFGFLSLVTGIALLLASVLAGGLWQQVGSWAAFGLGSGGAIAAMIALVFWHQPLPSSRS
jgi:MFS family permease